MAKNGFDLVRQQRVDEFDMQALFYRHHSGAQLLSLVNEDENKVFGINFPTLPEDSTGVAHILEHAVFCGSRKYPVKEPFVELLKGSHKTFLNAFTMPDRTCYPVASQNQRDFYNLVDVYLDAVFHPHLTPEVLQQEGWHYALEAPGESLSYKGVVFNEMKGAYSSPDMVLAVRGQQALCPGHIYGMDSGGDPRHIPKLDFDQFKAFHRKYYHPANALIFFSGDDDPDYRLELVDEYLKDLEPLVAAQPVAPVEPRYTQPRRVEYPYPASGDETKVMVAVNWLFEPGLDPDTLAALQVLDFIIEGTAAAPLRKALIESGLGEDLVGGMDTELSQGFFSTGLKGVEPGQEGAVEELVIETLEKLATAGVEAAAVEAALNTAEFRLRENNTGAYPRGLVLMLRVLPQWLYRGDPLDALGFEKTLATLRARLSADTTYLSELIRRHLLDNTHRVTVVLQPDGDMGRRLEDEERAELEQIGAAMSPDQLEAIGAQTQALRRRQETPDSPQNLATLPRLQLADLERQVKVVPSREERYGDVPMLYQGLSTNGIVYLDLGFDLRALPQELLPYLSLFSRALLEMGTHTEDFVSLTQRIGARTGGLWATTLVSQPMVEKSVVGRLFLRGKATLAQVGDLLQIVRDVLVGVRLDNQERFMQMVLEERAGEEAGLVQGGHGVVALRLRAQFDQAAQIVEEMEGINYLFFLRQLSEQVQRDWPTVLGHLEAVRQHLVNRQLLMCNTTLTPTDQGQVLPFLQEFIEELPDHSWTPQTLGQRAVPGSEGLVVPAAVNFVGKGANLYDLGYKLHGSVGVVSRHLNNTWLWDRIRVQGGAYGAFCSFDRFSGALTYVSYRDPNVQQTLQAFDQAGQFLKTLDLDRDELDKAIIGTVGDMDAYQLPDARGYSAMMRWLLGVSDRDRQQFRDEVFATSPDDFADFGQVLDQVAAHGQIVAMGERQALEQGLAGGVKTTQLM